MKSSDHVGLTVLKSTLQGKHMPTLMTDNLNVNQKLNFNLGLMNMMINGLTNKWSNRQKVTLLLSQLLSTESQIF